MSWWDTKGLTNFATQALKTAQKRIDKVLDIKEEEEQRLEQGNQALYVYHSPRTYDKKCHHRNHPK